MAKHLTPIVGLAVVMALALAAVFGSMSLANPVQAVANDASGEVYVGHVNSLDLSKYLTSDADTWSYTAEAVDGGIPITGAGSVETAFGFSNVFDSSDAAQAAITGDLAGTLTALDPDESETAVTNKSTLYFQGEVGGLPLATISEVDYAFKLTADDGDADTDDPSITVTLTLKRSTFAERNEDANMDDVEIPKVAMAYTETEISVDLDPVYKSGMGTGGIVGYYVEGGDFAMVKDATRGGRDGTAEMVRNDNTNVGPDGDLTLSIEWPEDVTSVPNADEIVTVYPICRTETTDATASVDAQVSDPADADHGLQTSEIVGTGSYQTCMLDAGNDLPAATFNVTIVASTDGSLGTSIPPQPLTIDEDGTVSAAMVQAAFNDGMGAGAIKSYRLVRDSTHNTDNTVVFAQINSMTGEVTLTGIDKGITSVYVEAVDGIAGNVMLIAEFVVRVRDAVADVVDSPALENGFIDNRSIQVGGAALRLDVRPYFTAGEGDGAITNYTFMSSSPDKATVNMSSATGRLTAVAVAAGTTVITVTAEDGNAADDPTQDFILTVMAAYEAPTPDVFTPRAPKAVKDNPDTDVNETVDAYSFMATSDEPGDSARYDIEFAVKNDVDTLNDELTIELEDFGFPSSVDTRSIGITVDEMDGTGQDRQFSPEL